MKRVKVILNEDVYNLGEEGDVREVAAGYARNFLIPQGMAMSHTTKNVAYFEQRKEAIEKRKEEKREAAKSFREKIESKVIELEMPAGDTGKLFGSVNSATVAEKLAAEGITIERKKIDVPENSIKMIGEYDVRIHLYGDEVAGVKVIVNPVGGKKVTAEAPAEEAAKAAPAEDTAEEAPEEEPVAEAVAEEAAAEEPVAEETAAEDAVETEPAAEAPVEEAAEEPAVEEAAAEEAPAEETAEADSAEADAAAETDESEKEGS